MTNGKVSKDFIFSATIGYSSTVGIRYPREVIARASIAYSAARRVGAGHVMEYSENIKQELMKIQGVLSNFMAGLMAGEFEVYYQPKVRIETKEIFGAEALYVGIEREGYQHRWSLFRFLRMTEA